MPLRQPPAEQPFSLIPPNWNPVSNDRVLPHLGLINSTLSSQTHSQFASFTVRSRSDWNCCDRSIEDRLQPCGQKDGFCHFDSDGFCRLTPILRCWSRSFPVFQEDLIFIFLITTNHFQKPGGPAFIPNGKHSDLIASSAKLL
jgi:hypothetical protein